MRVGVRVRVGVHLAPSDAQALEERRGVRGRTQALRVGRVRQALLHADAYELAPVAFVEG